jgi:hypothetical protein
VRWPALLVAHVSRRRADEAGDGVLLHVFGHVDAHEVILGIEEELRERLRQLVLPTPVGPEEQERAVGLVRVRESRARAADRVRDEAHGFVLAHDAPVQTVFHEQELLALALHHLGDRDAGGP